jgi:hypothetical protein
MTFDSTLRAETNDPKEIQKADFDLLEKLNRVGREVEGVAGRVDTIENTLGISTTVTIDASYTLKSTDDIVLVNTNDAIVLTVNTGLPVGHEFTVQRISSGLTANAITITSSDTFPVGSIFGNTVAAKTVRYSETFSFRKVDATTWAIVGGVDSGENANGKYELLCNGNYNGSGLQGTTTLDISTAFAGGFRSDPANSTITIPYESTSTDYAPIAVSSRTNATIAYLTARTSTNFQISHFRVSSATGTTVAAYWTISNARWYP